MGFIARRTARPALLFVLAGVASAIALSTVGCASHNRSRLPAPEQRAERNPIDREAFSALGYRLQWRGFAVMGARSGIRSAELMGPGFALLTNDAILTYIDAASGEFRWTDQPASPLTRFVGMCEVGDRIAVASESEVFIYDPSSSRLEKRQRFDQVVNTPPISEGGFLVFGTATGELMGHLVTSGFRAWSNALTGAINTPGTRVGNAVALASSTGQVIILDPRTGVSVGRNGDPLDGSDVALGSSSSAVFFASRDQSLYGINADGRRLWRLRTEAPLAWAPTHHEGRVYCTLPALGLAAVDASSGDVLWSNDAVEGEIVAIRRGNLLCWNKNSGSAKLIDAASGDVLESVTLRNVEHLVFSAFVDGDMYVVSPLGVVSKFVTRN